MNQSEQAQKGFKTFILTLSISLIVFSVVYYLMTSSSVVNFVPDIEAEDGISDSTVTTKADTVFGELASQEITDVQPRAVLAEADSASEPTQATGTPTGGVTSITMGLIVSAAIFMFGMYVIAMDPRRLALNRFEDQIKRDFN